jgi:hypothetical protein
MITCADVGSVGANEVEVRDMTALAVTIAAFHVPPHGPNDLLNVGGVLDQVLDRLTRREYQGRMWKLPAGN